MKIEIPSFNRKKEFLTMLNDYEKNDPSNAEFYQEAKNDFNTYITSLLDEEKGINLKPGFVPCTHRWLLDSHDNIVGIVRVRHRINTQFLFEEAGHIGYDVVPSFRKLGYGTKLLNHGLQEAKKLSIDKVLIIADQDNIGSIKIIENNGFKHESTVISKCYNIPIVRYWFHF